MSAHVPADVRPPLLPAALTMGFATAVAMWLVGFVTHLPSLRPPAFVIAILLIATQAAGAFLCGRTAGRSRSLALGFAAGLVTGLINLLIVGSVVAQGDDPNTLHPSWGLIAFGTLVFSAVLGAAFAFIGSSGARGESSGTTNITWLGRFGLVTVASAVPVLLSGGLVTSTGTGLAVPDWPTSYNANMFLYPLSKMTGGIYYEHAHRLFGSLVGLSTLVLLLFILIAERRVWVKALGGFAFVFVCAQGVLGGIRVTSATTVSDTPSPQQLADNTSSLALAAVHGTTAQIFFGVLCALAVILSPWWKRLEDHRPAHDPLMRPFALVLVAALCIQLVLGSVTRHFHHGHALLTHIAFALIVLVLALLTGFRASGRHADVAPLRTLGKALVHTVGLQLVLGIAALLALYPYEQGRVDPPYAVIIATAHQAVGALLMGTAWALAAASLRVGAAPRLSDCVAPA